jgi:hypothetical protein
LGSGHSKLSHAVDGGKWVNQQHTGIRKQIHNQVGERELMKQNKKASLSISTEAAARRLAGTAQERQAYLKLLEQEPSIVDTKQLAEAAADGAPDLYVARKTLHDLTIEQLATALRLALALL